MAGAHAVQVVSALLRHGPEHLAVVRPELARWLEEHEDDSLAQAQGSMSLLRCPDPAAFERANYPRVLQSWSNDRARRGIAPMTRPRNGSTLFPGCRMAASLQRCGMLDRLMPDAVERHHIRVNAPANVVFTVACGTDRNSSALVRPIFRIARVRPRRTHARDLAPTPAH